MSHVKYNQIVYVTEFYITFLNNYIYMYILIKYTYMKEFHEIRIKNCFTKIIIIW